MNEHGDDGDQPGPFRVPLRHRENDFLNLPTGSNECLTDWNFKAKIDIKWNLARQGENTNTKMISVGSFIIYWIYWFLNLFIYQQKYLLLFYQNEHQSLTFVPLVSCPSPACRSPIRYKISETFLVNMFLLRSGQKSWKYFFGKSAFYSPYSRPSGHCCWDYCGAVVHIKANRWKLSKIK